MVLKPSTGRPFVLLDRDGTLIEERHYLRDVEAVRLLPNAVRGLRRFRELGLGLVVVTNQSGVARGYFDMKRVDEVHARVGELLAREGLHLDAIYVCPHLPDAGCACRKPMPGLGLQAAADLGIDLSRSFVVGDKPGDIAWGHRLGATPFLVRTGHGASVELARLPQPSWAVDDLSHAAELVQRLIHGGRRWNWS